MKHMTTHPARYYERQSPAQQETGLQPHTRRLRDDTGYFVAILGVACWAFALGMVVTAAWAGAL